MKILSKIASKFDFTDRQADAILDMKLSRLAKLEKEDLERQEKVNNLSNVQDSINPMEFVQETPNIPDYDYKTHAYEDNDYISMSNPFTFKPTNYEDSKAIVNALIAGENVVINLDNMKENDVLKYEATRLIDYVCGACYVLKYRIVKLENSIYFSFLHPLNI